MLQIFAEALMIATRMAPRHDRSEFRNPDEAFAETGRRHHPVRIARLG